jgi:hypothetical protein
VEGQLLSGSDDAAVCLWDVRLGGLEISPLQKKTGHSNVWHKYHSSIFASVGDCYDRKEPFLTW